MQNSHKAEAQSKRQTAEQAKNQDAKQLEQQAEHYFEQQTTEQHRQLATKQLVQQDFKQQTAARSNQQFTGQPSQQFAAQTTEKAVMPTPDRPGANKDERSVQTPERLTRDIIRRKALELADEDGIENLTIRKLAKALNKTPMALYRHYESIDEIKQAVLALAFEEVDTDPIPGERWDDTIRRTTASIRNVFHAHPRALLHLIQSSALDAGLINHTNRIQSLHHNQGIPDDVLVRAWRIIDAFLSGFNIKDGIEMEQHRETALEDRPSWFETADKAYSDQAFHDGIEIIIAGIRNLAAPDPCEWHTPGE